MHAVGCKGAGLSLLAISSLWPTLGRMRPLLLVKEEFEGCKGAQVSGLVSLRLTPEHGGGVVLPALMSPIHDRHKNNLGLIAARQGKLARSLQNGEGRANPSEI